MRMFCVPNDRKKKFLVTKIRVCAVKGAKNIHFLILPVLSGSATCLFSGEESICTN